MELKRNMTTVFATSLWLCSLYIFVNGEMVKVNKQTVYAVSNSMPLIKGKNTHYEMDVKHLTFSLHQKFDEIVIALVVCGERKMEALVMMKSALVFSRSNIRFIIVAEDQLIPFFNKTMNDWMAIIPNKFRYEIHQLMFPENDFKTWKHLLNLCTTQRLFFPNMLSSVDALLYADIDSIVLGPLEELWSSFRKMNSSHFVGMAQEAEVPNIGWYSGKSKIPYYLPLGLNAGIILMNLTRMREVNWEENVIESYNKYKKNMDASDQDILNIIFHFHPEKVSLLPCRYHFRHAYCRKPNICKSALDDGIIVLHGNRFAFHKGGFQELQIVYKAMTEYQLGTDPYSGFLCKLKKYLENAEYTPCGDNYQFIFTKAAEEFLSENDPSAKC